MFNLTFSQISDEFSTIDFSENTNVQKSSTTLNLFDINYGTETVPFTISYNHNGIKVNENNKNGLGLGWTINSFGIIHRMINDREDNLPSGWFNTPIESYSSYNMDDSCESSCPSFISHTGNDYTPDFFSLSSVLGLNGDFLFKKNTSGGVTPVIISGDPDSKIVCNFSNISQYCAIPNSNVVFTVKDTKGKTYNFINGPKSNVYSRSSISCNNDFYISSITNSINPNNSIQFEYVVNSYEKRRYYSMGFNQYLTYNGTDPNIIAQTNLNNDDLNNNIVRNVSTDFLVEEENVNLLKKIITSQSEYEFIYTEIDGSSCLTEIKIKNKNAITIYSIVFEYFSIGDYRSNAPLLSTIRKYNADKSRNEKIYEFDYFPSEDDCEVEMCPSYDFFGYYNGKRNMTPLPFAVRNSNGVLIAAADRNPDINFAKAWSLKSIKNKFSGEKTFEYELKLELNNPYLNGSDFYAGGLNIKSITENPIISPSKKTIFYYSNLVGYGIMLDQPLFCYRRDSNNGVQKKYWKSDIKPVNNCELGYVPNLNLYNNYHLSGNMYLNIDQEIFDNDLNNILYKKSQTFIPNSETLNFVPVLTSETLKDSQGNILEEEIYTFTNQNIQSINYALFERETRKVGQVTHWFEKKTNKNLPTNRLKITNYTIKKYSGNDFVSKTTSFAYVNSNSKRKFSEQITNSNSDALINEYYYPDTITPTSSIIQNMVIDNLLDYNLKIISKVNSIVSNTELATFIKNASTNQLIKFQSSTLQKESQTSGVLNSDIYDNYDSSGNPVQYRENGNVSTTVLWGYNKTKVIAVIKNANMASVLTSLGISNINLVNETHINLINSLRSNPSYSNALIETYEYDSFFNLKKYTDVKNQSVFYNYDDLGNLISVKDNNGKLLSEYQYNLKP